MIDLNSLTLYKNKISSYLDDQMPLPSPKDILILNDELIDNYTGNGITKNGSVKIDENGIASGFNGSYITTTNDFTKHKTSDFEVQVKVYFDTKNYSDTSGWRALVNCNIHAPEYIHLSLNNNDQVYFCGFSSSVNRQCVIQLNDCGKYFKDKWTYIKFTYKNSTRTGELQLFDENLELLKSGKTVSNFVQNAYPSKVIFGRNMDSGDAGCYNCKIDLSETYFKCDGNLISSWNM